MNIFIFNTNSYMVLTKTLIPLFALLAVLIGSEGSGPLPARGGEAPTAPPAAPLVLYNWHDDIPAEILEAFTRETGLAIDYHSFASQEEAVEQLLSGKRCDVAVIDGRFLPTLISGNLLHPLNFENLTHFKYISPNFRNLSYDPDNTHSVPYSWGTTGILVNRLLVTQAVRRWADFWDDRFRGQVALSISYPREALGMTLKSLGYSANSENPREIAAALARLRQLRLAPGSLEVTYPEFGPAMMARAATALAIGFSGDLLEAGKRGLAVEYILPQEGLLLWADTFVVPKSSSHPAHAEMFINYLLRPEVSAAIVNAKHYASANEAAQPLVDPAILADPAIYPSDALLLGAEIIEALSPAGQALVDSAWQNFLSSTGPTP